MRDLENLIDPVIIIENGKIIFNNSIDQISKKLQFYKVGNNEAIDENVIYAEDMFGGKNIVAPNNSEIESQVDFELLFNAVLYKQTEITKQLKNK